MNSASAAFAVLLGLALRLAVPILLTVLVVFALGRLDRHWQAEAETVPLKVEKPKCWKTQGCAPAQRKACAGFMSPLPCWQVFRLPSGYLDEKCLGCPVLLQAPLPAHA
jgi:hypothetical protein